MPKILNFDFLAPGKVVTASENLRSIANLLEARTKMLTSLWFMNLIYQASLLVFGS